MTSPTRVVEEGSPTKHISIFSLRASSVSTTLTVPLCAGPSSSAVIKKAMEPLWSGCFSTKRSTAMIIEANEPFMSAAPRPCNMPSMILGSNGGLSQFASGPVGTTSVWPAKQIRGLASPLRDQKLSTSPKRSGSLLKPRAASRSIMSGWQPSSSGVTEWRAMRSLANCRVGVMIVPVLV